MSRTFRRKEGHGWSYGHRDIRDILTEHHFESFRDKSGNWLGYAVWDEHIDPRSKEGKKRIAKFHSDADYHRSRHGPSWWLREFVQRPYRREAKNQMRKVLFDDEFEHTILDKPKRPYWD